MQHNLNIADADRIAEWFLDRMGPEQRRQLMADMPLVYARVFSVAPSVVAGVVTAALDEQAAGGRHERSGGEEK